VKKVEKDIWNKRQDERVRDVAMIRVREGRETLENGERHLKVASKCASSRHCDAMCICGGRATFESGKRHFK